MSSESVSSAESNEQLVGLLRGKMEARNEHQNAKRYKAIYTCTTLIGVLVFGMVLLWCLHYREGFAWSSDPQHQFNWHPLLMTLGMILISSQSILLYRTGREGPKMKLKLWHGILHFVSFICTVIGLKAVFDSHNYAEKPIPNLYTMHSWIGLAAVIIFALQFCIGFVVFLLPRINRELKAMTLPVHVNFGIAIFIMSLTAALMGLTEKAIFSLKNYGDMPAEGVFVNFISVFMMLYGLLVIHLVTESKYKRIALPEEEMALAGHAE